MLNSQDCLLLVEDEEALGEGLKFNFEAEGFQVVWMRNGTDALRFIQENHASLSIIVLDLMLPGLDGYGVLEETRARAPQVPVIVLSAKSLEQDKVKALELGADDYVTKPFSLVELMLRVKGLSKRSKWYKAIGGQDSTEDAAEGANTKLIVGRAEFDRVNLSLRAADGSFVRLSPTEGLLLQVFIAGENRLLTRADLLEKVWQYEARVETRTVDVFVSKIRKYIETRPSRPEFLFSVRGVGYAYVTSAEAKAQLGIKG